MALRALALGSQCWRRAVTSSVLKLSTGPPGTSELVSRAAAVAPVAHTLSWVHMLKHPLSPWRCLTTAAVRTTTAGIAGTAYMSQCAHGSLVSACRDGAPVAASLLILVGGSMALHRNADSASALEVARGARCQTCETEAVVIGRDDGEHTASFLGLKWLKLTVLVIRLVSLKDIEDPLNLMLNIVILVMALITENPKPVRLRD